MSEADLVAALEHKYLACLIRGREFEPQSLADLADTRHLRGIARRQFAEAEPERILETDANMAAHRRRHRRDLHLRGARREHRPALGVAEQPDRKSQRMNSSH